MRIKDLCIYVSAKDYAFDLLLCKSQVDNKDWTKYAGNRGYNFFTKIEKKSWLSPIE